MNILHPTPNTQPSFLYSIAAAATELANPVIGTRLPAPPHFVIDGYILSPVRITLRRMSVTVVHSAASSAAIPQPLYISRTPCPTVHIIPPVTNAFIHSTTQLCLGVISSTYPLYISSLSLESSPSSISLLPSDISFTSSKIMLS